MEDFDQIMSALGQRKVLMIDGPLRAYITEEGFNLHKPYTVRTVRMKTPDPNPPPNWRDLPAKRYRTLTEALLSVEDCKWCDRDGVPISGQ